MLRDFFHSLLSFLIDRNRIPFKAIAAIVHIMNEKRNCFDHFGAGTI